jgi:hypothetical protein
MKSKLKFVALIAAALLPLSWYCHAQGLAQTNFCEEESGSLSVNGSLSLTVLDAVMRTKEGKQAQQQAASSGIELVPKDVLHARIIRLSHDSDEVFLVMGSQYPLSGADRSWFWIVRQSGPRVSVLLWTGANCIKILPHKTNGYADVASVWASAATMRTETYRYDGRKYRLAKVRQEDR